MVEGGACSDDEEAFSDVDDDPAPRGPVDWTSLLGARLQRPPKAGFANPPGEAIGVMRFPPLRDDERAAAKPTALAVGARVEACWEGGAVPFPGTIERVRAREGDDGEGRAFSYAIRYADGGYESDVPGTLVIAPRDVRTRTVDWRGVGTWVDLDGAHGRIIALRKAAPRKSGGGGAADEGAVAAGDGGLAPDEAAPPTRCDVLFDDGDEAHGVELARLAPILLVRYDADGSGQECVSARELNAVLTRGAACCTVIEPGRKPKLQVRSRIGELPDHVKRKAMLDDAIRAKRQRVC